MNVPGSIEHRESCAVHLVVPADEQPRTRGPDSGEGIHGPAVQIDGVEISSIEAPTLLLWGGSDPISPVSVGERLQTLLAKLHVIPRADHDLAQTHAALVADLIMWHLTAT
jgi:pimeloyl-ACP methyl ester carboxylesterase